MKIAINEVLYAFSMALDAVEGELAGASTYHSQRVAYISYLLGKQMGVPEEQLIYLVAAGLLHDNALTEYIQSELNSGIQMKDIVLAEDLGKHCAMGAANAHSLPFRNEIEKAILYHHERVDKSGPFRKSLEETPLFARIVHLADHIDVRVDFSTIDPHKYHAVEARLNKNVGRFYDSEVVDAFLQAVTLDRLMEIQGDQISEVLFSVIPRHENDFSSKELIDFSNMFARIIDYKSPFTNRHSIGIAEKARAMGEYYSWDPETCDKLYFAGALHDVGKLLVSNDILEKPGKLDAFEFNQIKNHAIGSYVILHSIGGLEDITSWAALHHEKLDGSGYPFGYTKDQLGEKERLMACLDIYQALTEPRPYKDGMSHDKAMEIIRKEVDAGKLDPDIAKDVDSCFAGK